MVNAGLRDDVAALGMTGADGIGLFRTEFQFLVSATLPRRESQQRLYKSVLDAAGDKPVIFRTVDVGGDKQLPYLHATENGEENPAMGWRALRLALDRDTLMKAQARALLEAAAGRDLDVMFPMVSEPWEFDQAKKLVEEQRAWLADRKKLLPQQHPLRRDARSAGARRDARRAAAQARLHVDRHQRSHPVPVRRRPLQPCAGRALRLAVAGDPALPAAGRARGRCGQGADRASAARWAAARSRRWR